MRLNKYTLDILLNSSVDALYEIYKEGYKARDLYLINTIRNIVSDKYCLKCLHQSYSPVDNWRNSKDIARFFTVNKL